jgi:hypothetical protein
MVQPLQRHDLLGKGAAGDQQVGFGGSIGHGEILGSGGLLLAVRNCPDCDARDGPWPIRDRP